MAKLQMLKPRLSTLKQDRVQMVSSSGEHGASRPVRELSRHERGYGTAWDRLRRIILRRDPLCKMCEADGAISASEQVDHIIPKARGGTDDESNLQGLCAPCHKFKTAGENARDSGGVVFAPEWLPMPLVPVVVVTGPPGSGKSTYVHERAEYGDLVLDLDQIAADLSGKPIYQTDSSDWRIAVRWRNAALASLASPGCRHKRAWLIVTAPKRKHREWWRQKLGASLVEMETPDDVCVARIVADHRRTDMVKTRHIDAVRAHEPSKCRHE